MKGKTLAGLIVVLLSVAGFTGCAKNVEEEFYISNIVFSSEEPNGYMDYKEQPNATYRPGNTVWLYMNLKGQEYRSNADETTEMWFAEQLTVKAPNGDVLVSKEAVNEHRNFPKEVDPNKVFLVNYITTTQQFAEGRYTVEIAVADKLADKTATASSTFIVAR